MIRWIQHEAWIDLLELGLVVALAVGLAHWTWIATSPRVVGAPGTSAEGAGPRAGASFAGNLFGAAQSDGMTSGRASVAAGLTLLGVLSGPAPSAGRAILAVQGSRPAIVAVGEPIGEGVELHEVHEDHVIILRDGAPERIDLERGARNAAPRPAPVRVPARR